MTETWLRFYRNGQPAGTLTFEETTARITEKQAELAARGINPGDRVLIQLGNSPELAILLLALRDAKIIAVPIHPKEAEERRRYIEEDAGCVARITTDGFEQLTPLAVPENPYPNLATILYTSGTTGNPKGVCHTNEAWDSVGDEIAKREHFGPGVVFASHIPLFHCAGYAVSMLATYRSGATLVLLDSSPDNVLEIIEKEQIAFIHTVPTVLYRVLHAHPTWKPPASFSYFSVGGSKLERSLVEGVLTKWGVQTVNAYGLTETGSFSASVPLGLSDEVYTRVMFPEPSIGVPLPGTELKIKDTEQEGVEGELLIRSARNLLGYWGKGPYPDEWFATGDLGMFRVIDGQRYYYVTGRIKEIIIRGGVNISPVAVESELRERGATGEFAVVGIPDEEFGEEIVLAYLGTFDTALLEQIPRYRRPKYIWSVAELPRTALGKVQRGVLTEQLRARQESDEVMSSRDSSR